MFKLVRADYRLPWIRSRFPDSPIISIRRNPRDCWASIVRGLPASQRHDPSINTGYDLLVWAAQLAEHFDAISSLRYGHSYEVAYPLWRVSNIVADRYADLVVDFDHELQADPTKALRQILKTAGLDGRKLGRKMLERIVSCPRSADEEYGNSVDFEAIEAHCEERLKDSGLLSSIAEGCLKAESWPLSQRSPSPFSESLGMEISRHRGELMRNRKAYLDSSLQTETQVEGLSRELEKRESVAGELREELEKLRTDSTGEIERPDGRRAG
ncbi:MAG: sulfotransferase, partial [bacterium]|nr:sulfotransferase [bacterium]